METLSPELLKILACPACDSRPALDFDAQAGKLSCKSCGRRYPVREGIPVLLVEEAEKGNA
jgi:uncharacterized protein YbaR (Trm112 family)